MYLHSQKMVVGNCVYLGIDVSRVENVHQAIHISVVKTAREGEWIVLRKSTITILSDLQYMCSRDMDKEDVAKTMFRVVDMIMMTEEATSLTRKIWKVLSKSACDCSLPEGTS